MSDDPGVENVAIQLPDIIGDLKFPATMATRRVFDEMQVYEIDPLRDPRWPDLLERDPRSSIFHTRGWLSALQRSYGYEPVVLTTSGPGKELTNGVAFCRVKSWLTGQRLASLPFSDHCEPLITQPEEFQSISSFLQKEIKSKNLSYAELRPLEPMQKVAGFKESSNYFFHKLDLRPSCDELYRHFHNDCIRRKIQRSQREGLTYEKGTSRQLLAKFYGLFAMTRHRHGLPPAPFSWLCNVLDCVKGNAQIRVASHNGNPVAVMLTLTHNRSIVYKYGGSDLRYSNLGGLALLFWKTIQEAKTENIQELDFGRCETDNPGLIKYKDRWGTTKSNISYWRMSGSAALASSTRWHAGIATRIFPYVPQTLRIRIGDFLYRHAG